MNKELLILIFLSITSCKATQFVSNDVIEIPRQKFKYQLNEKTKVVEVFPFYISIYPESNKNYKKFLASHSKEEKTKALPEKDFLETFALNDEQIDFLISEYYNSTEYDNYPIIGLSKTQIKDYLQWKSDKRGKEILKANDIEFNPDKTYLEIIEELNIKPKFLQAEYNVLLEAQAMSAKVFIGSKNAGIPDSPNRNTSNNKILESLGIQEIEHYKIDKSVEIGELIYNQIDTINHYTSLHQTSNKTFKTNIETNILIPLRTWHIKL